MDIGWAFLARRYVLCRRVSSISTDFRRLESGKFWQFIVTTLIKLVYTSLLALIAASWVAQSLIEWALSTMHWTHFESLHIFLIFIPGRLDGRKNWLWSLGKGAGTVFHWETIPARVILQSLGLSNFFPELRSPILHLALRLVLCDGSARKLGRDLVHELLSEDLIREKLLELWGVPLMIRREAKLVVQIVFQVLWNRVANLRFAPWTLSTVDDGAFRVFLCWPAIFGDHF